MTLRLHDKLFISTRPKDSSDELTGLLSREGATVLELPLIEINAAPVSENEKSCFYEPEQFQWIIFTSPNGVRYFFRILEELTGSYKLPGDIQFAAIGKKTEAILQEYGYRASFINPGSTAEDFSKPFLKHIKTGGSRPNILLPLGNLARTVIQDELKHAANCTRIDVYTTDIPPHFDETLIHRIEQNNYDMLIFTSPSGIKNFLIVSPKIIVEHVRMACIGPVTYREAINNGFQPLVTAHNSSAGGIVDSILNYYISKK